MFYPKQEKTLPGMSSFLARQPRSAVGLSIIGADAAIFRKRR
jgi:hypothetical protein